ncbi:CsgG/HfaB family protein [Parachryseolinea silvisoli]|uniref:CsgG/HfaB family protein n=1 Tax=Parachryseolinea silvisoli TaxID=2873601 RepID=UPI002265F4C6|nr:CsgG/HfaB family protein [Parachryseolinea silvisoli]MCD9017492.1 CsgG/HfaB family protein [Parachryseolinea silvisoli]
MNRLRHFFLLSLLSFSFCAFSQSVRPTIIFQDMQSEDYPSARDRAKGLHEATLDLLVNANKVAIVTRSGEMWKAIENELAMKDFVDPRSAIDLGKMSGAKYLLVGNLTRVHHEEKIRTSGSTSERYFSATAFATLKILNLETGQFEKSFQAEVNATATDREEAIRSSLKLASQNLAGQVNKHFPVAARIDKQVSSNQVSITKGTADGLHEQEFYEVLSDDGHTVIGQVKITFAAEHGATARVLQGDVKNMAGKLAREPQAGNASVNVARVERIDGNHVVIDAGRDLNIQKGDAYKCVRTVDEKIGDHVNQKEEILGRIYITDVYPDYAEGKLYRGVGQLETGVQITESNEDRDARKRFVHVGYKSALSTTIEATKPTGIVTVRNENGEYTVDTSPLGTFQDIESIAVYTVGFGVKNLVKDLSTSLLFDIYRMDHLNNWIGRLEVLYELPLVPEKLHVTLGPSLGYGGLKQEIPASIIDEISKGKADKANASSIFFSGQAGLSWTQKRFVLSAAVSYDYMKFKKWKYDVAVEDETKNATAPATILPYSNVDLSGLYYNVGLSYLYHR